MTLSVVNLMLVNTNSRRIVAIIITVAANGGATDTLGCAELIIVETNHSVCLGRRDRSADSETETACV